MTPHHIIAKIRERFPELGKDVLMTPECCCVAHNSCPDFHFKKEWSPLDWSHVLRVLEEWQPHEFMMTCRGHFYRRTGAGDYNVHTDVIIDLTKSPEWNIENNKDFASLLERCLTE